MTELHLEAVPTEDNQLLAAFVGPAWRHYRRSFKAFEHGVSSLRWNWAAAVVPAWLAYRRMYVLQVFAIVLQLVLVYALVLLLSRVAGLGALGLAPILAYLIVGLLEGFLGDRLLHARARRALVRMPRRDDRHQTIAWLRRRGGVSLIGALAVPVVFMAASLGVGAELLQEHVPAARLALKQELRNLVAAQEEYFATHAAYARSVADLMVMPGDGAKADPPYDPSRGVTVVIRDVMNEGGGGFSATARMSVAGKDYSCSIWVGRAARRAPDTPAGEPHCD